MTFNSAVLTSGRAEICGNLRVFNVIVLDSANLLTKSKKRAAADFIE
jgi:hypothetical protein